MKFEIFVNQPVKVEVEASTYEEAVKIIKSQIQGANREIVTFNQAIEVKEDV